MQCSLLNNIEKTRQEEKNKHANSAKPGPSQYLKIYRVGIKKDYLYVKQNKENGDQEIFYGHGLTGIAHRADAAFKIL